MWSLLRFDHQVQEQLLLSPRYATLPEAALHDAVSAANKAMHATETFDDHMSGTTCVAALLRGCQLYVANCGDSRAVLAERRAGRLVAMDLTRDQTPYRHAALCK